MDEITTPEENAAWSRLHHTLVKAKRHLMDKQMRAVIRKEEGRIRWNNRDNANTAAAPTLILEMHLSMTDQWAERLYNEVYIDVWNKQANDMSAAFVRAVFKKIIVPLIHGRRDAVIDELENFARRTSYPKTLLDGQVGGFKREMEGLKDTWRNRVDSDADEIELARAMPPLVAKVAGRPVQPLSAFDRIAGQLFVAALTDSEDGRVSVREVLRIAEELDKKGLKLLSLLERSARSELSEHNQKHARSAIKTWVAAVKHPRFSRMVRRRVYRAAEKYKKACPPLSAK